MPTSNLQKAKLLLLLPMFVLFVVACSGDDDEDTPPAVVEPIERGADIPIVIPAGEPLIIGVSTALTGGPAGERGAEYRDAAIVAVERWKQQSDDLIGGHEIEVHAEDDGCSNTEITTRAAGHMLRGEDEHPQLPGLVWGSGAAMQRRRGRGDRRLRRRRHRDDFRLGDDNEPDGRSGRGRLFLPDGLSQRSGGHADRPIRRDEGRSWHIECRDRGQ